MAAKRPLKSTSYRGGKVVGHGRAATLRGAVLSATRRMLLEGDKKISAVEIMNPKEQVLADVCWSFEYHIVGDQTLLIRFKRGHHKWLRTE
jgi:hypothetical protein